MNAKLFTGLAMSAFLFGCASSSDLEALSGKVDALADEVNALAAANNSEHDAMAMQVGKAQQAAEDAQAEAARANARIDNMASGYTK